MSRDKEIQQASKEFCGPYEDEKLFQRGARWADKTMIEKVEQWLTKSGRGQMIGSFHRFLEEE